MCPQWKKSLKNKVYVLHNFLFSSCAAERMYFSQAHGALLSFSLLHLKACHLYSSGFNYMATHSEPRSLFLSEISEKIQGWLLVSFFTLKKRKFQKSTRHFPFLVAVFCLLAPCLIFSSLLLGCRTLSKEKQKDRTCEYFISHPLSPIYFFMSLFIEK